MNGCESWRAEPVMTLELLRLLHVLVMAVPFAYEFASPPSRQDGDISML